jgi:hypothetical protein
MSSRIEVNNKLEKVSTKFKRLPSHFRQPWMDLSFLKFWRNGWDISKLCFYASFEIFVCTLLSYFLKYFQFIFEENLTVDFCCRIISLAVWNQLLKNPRIPGIVTKCCIGIEEILISPTSTIIIFHRWKRGRYPRCYPFGSLCN